MSSSHGIQVNGSPLETIQYLKISAGSPRQDPRERPPKQR